MQGIRNVLPLFVCLFFFPRLRLWIHWHIKPYWLQSSALVGLQFKKFMVVVLESIILQSDTNRSKLSFPQASKQTFTFLRATKNTHSVYTSMGYLSSFHFFQACFHFPTHSNLVLVFPHFPRLGGGYSKDDKSFLCQFSENWKRKSKSSYRNTCAKYLSWSHLTNTQTGLALEK